MCNMISVPVFYAARHALSSQAFCECIVASGVCFVCVGVCAMSKKGLWACANGCPENHFKVLRCDDENDGYSVSVHRVVHTHTQTHTFML